MTSITPTPNAHYTLVNAMTALGLWEEHGAAAPSADDTVTTQRWIERCARLTSERVSAVPAGRYALVNESRGIEFYRVDKPSEGKWAGKTFVKRQAGDDFYTMSRSHQQDALRAIAGDPKAAMLRYGIELGRCGHCGRTLTNDESRALGIGPVCREKIGF